MKLSEIGVCAHRKGTYSKKDGVMFYCDFAPEEQFPLGDVFFVCREFCPLRKS